MRTCILVSSLMAIAATAAPMAAQSLPPDPGTWHLSIGAGATIPVGNTSDRLDTGIHGVLALGYQFPDSHTMLGVEGMYLWANNKTLEDDHSDIVVVTAHAHVGLGSAAYFVLGAGVLRDEYQQPLRNIVITNTHAAFAVEGGLGINLGRVLFLEGRVIHSFRNDEHAKYTLIPITLGLSF